MNKKSQKPKKPKTVSFSTTLTLEAKEALTLFCKRRGLRINHFLEEIIWDRLDLEDEIDTEIANADSDNELIDLDDLRESA